MQGILPGSFLGDEGFDATAEPTLYDLSTYFLIASFLYYTEILLLF